MFKRYQHIHFVGIGGIGMSGIAEILLTLGYRVSGSDQRRNETVERLERMGAKIFIGHSASNVEGVHVLVYSSAVSRENVEVQTARQHQVPTIPRAEMLAELMRLRFSIAVAGSHGKTTTTSMIALVLERAGLDPTAVIGGRLSAFGSNARLGRGDYLVAEADESDRSFLMLWPSIAVITNIDDEHMESYGSLADLQAAFVEFAGRVPFYGATVACADDPNLRAVLPHLGRRVVTYGLDSPDAHVRGTEVALGAFGGRCAVHKRTHDGVEALGLLELTVPGRHNLLNALAAVAAADNVGLEFSRIASALAGFHGAERRFARHGEVSGVLLVDDYGHHPTEIAAVVAAARTTLNRRLVVAFQPHRYSRTAHLMDAFGPALRGADEIVLTDIYAAGEEPIAGVTIDRLAEAIRAAAGCPVHLALTLDQVVTTVVTIARPGDAVITLGAGSIGTLPARLLKAFEAVGERP
jgi:UDP-N-acetylmuramate--alanine ligase